MRNPTLHGLLLDFAEQAGFALARETAAGAEIPFEVSEERGDRRRPALYCYRPLTGRFIDERFDAIAGLESHGRALRALERMDGLDDYLKRRTEGPPPAAAAPAAVRAFLAAVYDGSSDFELQGDRLEAAYAELESALYRGKSVVTVIVPVLGLALESAELALGDALVLARGENLPDAPADAIWGSGPDASVVAVITRDDDPDQPGPDPVTLARGRLRRLLTGLRLWDSCGVALGPAGWVRRDDGAWRMFGNPAAGRSRGRLFVPTAQEDALRAFGNLVGRRAPRSGELWWALRRFELGCERSIPIEALTDFLLALRAVLEPEGPSSGRLVDRLAALCAEPLDRPALTERIVAAIALERAAMTGSARTADADAEALVAEVGHHLRCLLRDAVCGHLPDDLRGLAQEILAEDAQPISATSPA